eukprot:9177134-Pyramimonas_sp.AAC.1
MRGAVVAPVRPRVLNALERSSFTEPAREPLPGHVDGGLRASRDSRADLGGRQAGRRPPSFFGGATSEAPAK